MKTLSQIRKKANYLKNKLSKTKNIYENFGDKEQRQLNDFIGNEWDYDYFTRLEINNIQSDFFNFCINYSL